MTVVVVVFTAITLVTVLHVVRIVLQSVRWATGIIKWFLQPLNEVIDPDPYVSVHLIHHRLAKPFAYFVFKTCYYT